MWFWEAAFSLPVASLLFFVIALVIAFGFEFINGFHDTANAVTTVIYSRTMKPTQAVVYSGIMNFCGALLGGTAVAFSIVNLLPVDLLIDANSNMALVMVLSLLIAGVVWNLGTWYFGLPVSSSHTLIGSILGVGLAHGLLSGIGMNALGWQAVIKACLALVISPLVGFCGSLLLLLCMKRLIKEQRLYDAPKENDKPPNWIRGVLAISCGAVSFAHGSNDGQKGMGLILLVLVGFLPFLYALNTNEPNEAAKVMKVLPQAKEMLGVKVESETQLREAFATLELRLDGKKTYDEVAKQHRWEVRQAIYHIQSALPKTPEAKDLKNTLRKSIEFVPYWVVVGVATALGIGTMVGYKRIVVTVAEKIGKSHLTYAQGATAETVAALTILAADFLSAPVSTTQVLSSGIAGTMVANRSGLQTGTVSKILLAWLCTLPCTMLLSGLLFAIGRLLV